MTTDIAIRYCDEYLARNISDIDKEFLKIAKEALKQEPCEDVISRKATIKYLCTNMNWHDEDGEIADDEEKLNAITDLVNGVPSVTQQPWKDKYIKEIDHLRKYISKLETQIVEQEPKSEWQQDHEILKAYSDGANDVLGKIRAEIETKYGHCNLCEYGSEYDRVYTDIGDIADILQIIDKYMAERSEKK